jgi:peptidoglycan pentaglycine glycine transferase (the first glycine)
MDRAEESHMPLEPAVLRPVSVKAEWDAQVSRLPNAHFLQSYAWAEFKQAYGWQAQRYSLVCDTGTTGYATLLTRRLVPGLSVGYVPRGPLLAGPGPAVWASALAALEDIARKRRLLWLKVDPEIWDVEATTWAAPALRQRGWRKGEEVQFRNSVFLDVAQDEADLAAHMKPKTRYNVRLAERKGVTVEAAGTEALDELYSLYQQTANQIGRAHV